jgi:hypothetical protein
MHVHAPTPSPGLTLSVVQVEDFVHELCEGIMEETLLNVGVIYITLYSGETEVERFPFVTHVRRCALMHPPPNDTCALLQLSHSHKQLQSDSWISSLSLSLQAKSGRPQALAIRVRSLGALC